jgi:hypothetical protein
VRVIIDSTGIYDLKVTSIDSSYQLTSEYIAEYSASAVIKGLVGKTGFGTDFPIIRRKYPVVRVLDDRIIIFDPSEY